LHEKTIVTLVILVSGNAEIEKVEMNISVQLLFVTCTEDITFTSSGRSPKKPTGRSSSDSACWIRITCWNFMPTAQWKTCWYLCHW